MIGAVSLYAFMLCTGKIFPFQILEPKFRKAAVTFVRSVCLSVSLSTWNNSAPTGRILMKLVI